MSGLPLTSNDYDFVESGKWTPKRPRYYGQKKNATKRQGNTDRPREREAINLTYTYRSVKQDQN